MLQAGIDCWAFRQLKIYIHLRPIGHNFFSERVTGSDIFLSIPKFLRLVLIKVNGVLVGQMYSTVQEDFAMSMAA